jgi:hypothetical protein
MRLLLSLFFAFLLPLVSAQAQSISDNLPPEMAQDEPDTASATPAAHAADNTIVSDVSVDVTADNATHARDQALMQAERSAYVTLCARLNAPESAAKLNDDGVAALVQSFELQSEHVSAVRYIGVFTIRFNPVLVQKKLGKSAPVIDVNGDPVMQPDAKPIPQGAQSRVTVAVVTDSLAAWTQIKRRLVAVPQITQVDTLDLGRGLSHITVAYTGTILDLQQAVNAQGFVLRQNQIGVWELTDGSMVPR